MGSLSVWNDVWSFASTECARSWSAGIFRRWNTGILRRWSMGIFRRWSVGIFQKWWLKVMSPYSFQCGKVDLSTGGPHTGTTTTSTSTPRNHQRRKGVHRRGDPGQQSRQPEIAILDQVGRIWNRTQFLGTSGRCSCTGTRRGFSSEIPRSPLTHTICRLRGYPLLVIIVSSAESSLP